MQTCMVFFFLFLSSLFVLLKIPKKGVGLAKFLALSFTLSPSFTPEQCWQVSKSGVISVCIKSWVHWFIPRLLANVTLLIDII